MPALLTTGSSALSCPPAAPAHAWMPSSPCGPTCVDITPAAGSARAATRILSVLTLLLAFPAVNLMTPPPLRPRLHRRYARTVLRACGLQLRIIDRRGESEGKALPDNAVHTSDEAKVLMAAAAAMRVDGAQAADSAAAWADVARGVDSAAARADVARAADFAATQADVVQTADSAAMRADGAGAARVGDVTATRAAGEGLLVVAGHVGWTDVLALAAVSPMGFVARGDLIDWPVLGGLARLMRVIPIERERLRQLPEVVGAVAGRLAAGERVGVFPEGTTWCGRAHGRLRPALFQAAVDAGAAVQPVRIRYLDRHGELSTVPGFVGLDTFVDSAKRVLRSKGVVAEVVLLPVEPPGTDRHELARRCERALRGAEVVDIDAHATAVGTGPTREIVPDPAKDPAA
ncbi:lysophospholipid acyltransferase family protein [Nocardia terpenica]|uniref:lysophospholipid acyltransferase family protein n=1 Tax=Nocardia terpenica TaxID=455432 RepID=UPI001EEA214A|nr:lysophospholipid acyltransferase family protein [Nocardia terpenica]